VDVTHELEAISLHERDVHDDRVRNQGADGGTSLTLGLHFSAND
jgi:hypothetical protein